MKESVQVVKLDNSNINGVMEETKDQKFFHVMEDLWLEGASDLDGYTSEIPHSLVSIAPH